MDHTRLGHPGLRFGAQVPVIGQGTWRQPHDVITAAWAAGVRVFDTSPMYRRRRERGPGGGLRGAELVLGQALDVASRARLDLVVSTKIWAVSAHQGREQLHRALDFFGELELVQIQNLQGWRHHLPVLEAAREAGQVGLIGATAWVPSMFAELEAAMRTGRLHTIQVPYHPGERTIERRILPLAADLGLGVIVMHPLGDRRLGRLPIDRADLAPVEPFGVRSWSQALIKWALSDPRCHLCIPGTVLEDGAYHERSPGSVRRDRPEANVLAGCAPWFGPEERAAVARLAGASRATGRAAVRCR